MNTSLEKLIEEINKHYHVKGLRWAILKAYNVGKRDRNSVFGGMVVKQKYINDLILKTIKEKEYK